MGMVSIRESIDRLMSELTTSERKLASVILSDYPFSALKTIQELAEASNISAPSISRFVSKIGCNGYAEFQRRLVDELKESNRSPLDLQTTQNAIPTGDFFAGYVERINRQLHSLSAGISQQQFELLCQLVADPARNVFFLGGRMSDSIAAMFSMHLRQMRGKIHHLPTNAEVWPDYILKMRKQDLLVLFDFRRYQPDIYRLARTVATHRQSIIMVITDKWLSPAAEFAHHVVVVPTELETAWDSQVSAVVLIEAMIVQIGELNWAAASARIDQWDKLRLEAPLDGAAATKKKGSGR